MGLMQSLGRLWNGKSHRDAGVRSSGSASVQARRVSAAVEVPAPEAGRPARGGGVDAIDRELTERLGLKPSPLPSRQVREPERVVGRPAPAPVAVAAGVAAGVGLTTPGVPPVTGEVLEAIPLSPDGEHQRVGGHTNVISALLAMPGEARGRLRSKQQVLDQLKENYEEVLRVIRKVDSQLDQQQRRGERMLEIAEHTAHGRLPEIREETRKVGDAIDRLSSGLARGQDRLEKGVADQVAAIERVQGLLTQLVEADRSLGEGLVEFRRVAAGMAVATERLGGALAGLSERAQRRDEQIAEVLDRSQKTLVTVLVLSIVSVATAITMVLLAIV